MIGRPPGDTFGLALPRTAKPGPTVYVIECSTCGFTPEGQLTTRQGRCPKCRGFAWHRVDQSRRSLARDVGPDSD